MVWTFSLQCFWQRDIGLHGSETIVTPLRQVVNWVCAVLKKIIMANAVCMYLSGNPVRKSTSLDALLGYEYNSRGHILN